MSQNEAVIAAAHDLLRVMKLLVEAVVHNDEHAFICAMRQAELLLDHCEG